MDNEGKSKLLFQQALGLMKSPDITQIDTTQTYSLLHFKCGRGDSNPGSLPWKGQEIPFDLFGA